jgi:hypothetical protein
MHEARSRRNRELGIKPQPSSYSAELNVKEFEKFLIRKRIPVRPQDVADYLGLGYGTAYRALNEGVVSAPFLFALARRLPTRTPLQRFFTVLDAREYQEFAEVAA